MEKLSAAMENYLKTIYSICRFNTMTHVSEIAAKMNLSKASVCRATDILSDKGLSRKDKYRDLSFTAEGLYQAELISNKYDIIQTFLNEVLDVDPSVAEKDACSFEHSISLKSLQSMKHCIKNNKMDETVRKKSEQF
ncbi:MAG: Transcriptional regulator MntR [Pelotomaculum sp. PtaB.Bin013]|nr:MAG: Transcriptional regulator MntR [Pelotomaculum sp. PtaB.Bin013]